VKLFKAAADSDNVLTRCERWTFRFILASNLFTDAAFAFLNEALAKLAQNESSDMDVDRSLHEPVTDGIVVSPNELLSTEVDVSSVLTGKIVVAETETASSVTAVAGA